MLQKRFQLRQRILVIFGKELRPFEWCTSRISQGSSKEECGKEKVVVTLEEREGAASFGVQSKGIEQDAVRGRTHATIKVQRDVGRQ